MFALGESHADYIPSSMLAQKIQLFNERGKKLFPYLASLEKSYVIDSSQDIPQVQKQIRSFVEPTIVHVRSSGSDGSATVKAAIQQSLCENHGFIELNVNDLIREESDRRTKLGNRLLHSYSTG